MTSTEFAARGPHAAQFRRRRRQHRRPPVQKCCAEMMSVWVAGISKNRCRTTVAEPIGANASGTALTGDQAGLFKAQPGRSANWRGCEDAPSAIRMR